MNLMGQQESPTHSSELRPGSSCRIDIVNIDASLKVFPQYVKIKLRTQVDNYDMYWKHSENLEIFIGLASEHAHYYFTFQTNFRVGKQQP